MSRDNLRSAILSSGASFKKEIVEYNGSKYEVRQPSRGGRSDLFEKCKGENGELKGFELTIWATIYNTYVPGTNTKVFEDEDYAALNSLPAGGILDKLGIVATGLLNADEDVEKK